MVTEGTGATRFPFAAQAARHPDRDYYAAITTAYRHGSPEMVWKAASRRRSAGQRMRDRA